MSFYFDVFSIFIFNSNVMKKKIPLQHRIEMHLQTANEFEKDRYFFQFT